MTHDEFVKMVSDRIDKIQSDRGMLIFAGNESYFSWRKCEICNRNLGGDRDDYVLMIPGSKEHDEYSICLDCRDVIEYGMVEGIDEF